MCQRKLENINFPKIQKNRKRGRKIAQVRSTTFDGKDKYISSRIKRMSVAELRQLLDKHRVPHKDCIEKCGVDFSGATSFASERNCGEE